MISHPDKILFPKGKITKQDLVDYYASVSSLMLPLLKGRPISMKRYPQGITKVGFFQKNAPEGMPDFVKTVKVKREEGSIHMVLCEDKKTLLWLANLNCITPHLWLSRYDKPDQPDRMIFDLDPGSKTRFSDVIKAALSLKEILEKKYKLSPFLMTTGSRGLHVVVPLKRGPGFDEVRAFARSIAEELTEQNPDKYTLESRKIKRRGRLFIDVLRNGHAQTAVAPYAVRSIEGAPVATPLFWHELKNSKLRPDGFTIRNIGPRLKKNPWKGIDQKAKKLPKSSLSKRRG